MGYLVSLNAPRVNMIALALVIVLLLSQQAWVILSSSPDGNCTLMLLLSFFKRDSKFCMIVQIQGNILGGIFPYYSYLHLIVCLCFCGTNCLICSQREYELFENNSMIFQMKRNGFIWLIMILVVDSVEIFIIWYDVIII